MAISQIYDMSARQVWVGRYDEHGSREVAWDVSPWTSNLGSEGVFALLVTRPRDTDSPYNAQVSYDATTNLVTWAVTDIDTALKGWGRAELHYYVDGALVKSQTFVTIIERAMFAGSTAPSAAESWVERMEQAALDAQAAAETAEDAETTATSAATTATSAAATATNAANSASSSASSARADAATATNAATAAASSASTASTSATNAAASAEAASTSALTASTAASTATTKASQASSSASTAAASATTATTAAQTATTKAGEASTSASTATSAKDTAVSASQTATTKATEATTAAATATSAATTATTAKNDAVSAKTAAQTAQTGAETAAASVQSSAAQIATNTSDINQLKEDLNATNADLLKAFPTDTASGAIASFADGANVPVKSLIVDIDPVQDTSGGDPSPTNICPISGWSEVNVEHTGTNIWDEEWELGAYNANGTKSDVTDRIRSKKYIPVDGGSTYYIKAPSEKIIFYLFFDKDKNALQTVVLQTYVNTTISAPTNAVYMLFYMSASYGTSYSNDISINYPSTDHAYHPYSGQSINIQLGQTVYGGKLDVVSGVLTVDRVMIDPTDYTIARASGDGTLTTAWIKNIPEGVDFTAISNRFSSNLTSSDAGYMVLASDIYAKIATEDLTADNAAGLQTWFANNETQFCYELATPTTVTLTATEVETLLGDNTIYADTGDISVTYRADPTLYIQRLTVPDSDMIADANITSGQYFMVGNTLYKATANIASGGAITPNVNCTRKSLSEALNELNA